MPTHDPSPAPLDTLPLRLDDLAGLVRMLTAPVFSRTLPDEPPMLDDELADAIRREARDVFGNLSALGLHQ